MKPKTYTATLKILTKLATAHKSRKSFNEAVEKRFTKLGSGAFRHGFSTDGRDFAFKIRRHKPRRESGFSLSDINSSNRDEFDAYNSLRNSAPSLAAFMVAPKFHKLPNRHDVIFMPRVKTLGDDWEWETDGWDKLAREQHELIDRNFRDAHGGNIGYTGNLRKPGCRLYMIDLNMGEPYFAQESDDAAKQLLARLDAADKRRGAKSSEKIRKRERAAKKQMREEFSEAA